MTTERSNDDIGRNSNSFFYNSQEASTSQLPSNSEIQARCTTTIERSDYETRRQTLNYQFNFLWPDGFTGIQHSLPRMTYKQFSSSN